MAVQPNLMRRWEDYRPSKAVLFWACAGCAIATVVVGFNWGGWVTGGNAELMVNQATADARATLAASICVDRFGKGPDMAAQLASLKGIDTWKQDQFIEKGGWATLPGMADPVAGAAALCAHQLIEAKSPPKSASTSG